MSSSAWIIVLRVRVGVVLRTLTLAFCSLGERRVGVDLSDTDDCLALARASVRLRAAFVRRSVTKHSGEPPRPVGLMRETIPRTIPAVAVGAAHQASHPISATRCGDVAPLQLPARPCARHISRADCTAAIATLPRVREVGHARVGSAPAHAVRATESVSSPARSSRCPPRSDVRATWGQLPLADPRKRCKAPWSGLSGTDVAMSASIYGAMRLLLCRVPNPRPMPSLVQREADSPANTSPVPSAS
ncbi:hypothetical protein B0H10DRAFT_2112844 [Mycena sp. CBHHK59/15]|nr:hypothetical protein B0H10DRAFT_2112844 [Mycena sp. CBHHK59/15]